MFKKIKSIILTNLFHW